MRIDNMDMLNSQELNRQIENKIKGRIGRYFWDFLSSVEAEEKLLDAPDGSFLVHKSPNRENCILVVRDSGTTKHLLIIEYDGKYGFTKALTFESIADLIEYYTENSLAQYSSRFTTHLTCPVFFNTREDSETLEEAVESLKLMNEEKKQIELIMRETQDLTPELQLTHLTMCALQTEVGFLREQLSMLKKNHEHIEPGETKIESDIINKIQNNIITSELKIEHEHIKLRDLFQRKNEIQESLISLRIKIKEIIQLIELKRKMILRKGITSEYFLNILLMDEKNYPNLAISDNWFLEKHTTEDLLKRKEHGTFLIRKNRNGCYFLSVKCENDIHHKVIYRSERQFYGLTENICLFKTLSELVIHYHCVSLSEHFTGLNVHLLNPLNNTFDHSLLQE